MDALIWIGCVLLGIIVGIPLAFVIFNAAFKVGLIRFLPW